MPPVVSTGFGVGWAGKGGGQFRSWNSFDLAFFANEETLKSSSASIEKSRLLTVSSVQFPGPANHLVSCDGLPWPFLKLIRNEKSACGGGIIGSPETRK